MSDYLFQLSCDDSNVTVVEDSNEPGKFHISYPDYTSDTIVNFIATITDNEGVVTRRPFSKKVLVYPPPMISKIMWDQSIQYEQRSYLLTILAEDFNGLPITYDLKCNDVNVVIEQQTAPNQFKISYPDYPSDRTVRYELTVTNDKGSSSVKQFTQEVLKYRNPIIRTVYWSSDTQYERETYEVTINADDPNGLALTYNIICDHPNVIITQNSSEPEKFEITYPDLTEDELVIFTVSASNSVGLNTVKPVSVLVHHYGKPTVTNVRWNDVNHYESHSYIMTIEAVDDFGFSLVYDVSCNDPGVTIIQDTNDPFKFSITYPDYSSNTDVTFTVIVTNSTGLSSDPYVITKTVMLFGTPEIISCIWNNDYHQEETGYFLTIHASDPNGLDLSYSLSCDDPNVVITPYGSNGNQFSVFYPTFLNDRTIHYTVIVTNSNGKYSTKALTVVVHNYKSPVIDNIVWSETNQWEGKTYDLIINAHDPDGYQLTYAVTSNPSGIYISQDTTNPNIFHITYPIYGSTVNVQFYITVTNTHLRSTSQTINSFVNSYKPPIVTELSWSSTNQYENNTYTLHIGAIDPQNQNLTYQITCSEPSVTVEQSSIHNSDFNITYPIFHDYKTITFTAVVTNESGLVGSKVTTITVRPYDVPNIMDVSWDDFDHWEHGSYTLTIDANDPNGLPLTYQVVCNRQDVTVVQDTTNTNVFHVTYPGYPSNTDIQYTVTVSNTIGLTDTIFANIVVKCYESPLIEDISWNDNLHIEQHSYDLTIIARDPQNRSITYQVDCSDANVTIVQDTTNPNVFHITYPGYDINQNVTYTVTVTNDISLETVETIDIPVYIYGNPVIQSILWDPDTDHVEQHSYELIIVAVDPQNLDISYQVSSDDINVTIESIPGSENRFNITYPDYTADTNVTFTITVTNSDNLFDTTSISKIVQSFKPPVINRTFWSASSLWEQHNYTLTVDATDPQDHTLTYDASTLLTNITIDHPDPNLNTFTVSFGDFGYPNTTDITITITVTNDLGLTTTYDLVIPSNEFNVYGPPIIDDLYWDTIDQYEQNTYTLTIVAHDEKGLPITYQVDCNRTEASITQDTNNSNVFYVTYDEMTDDLYFDFNITVTNSENQERNQVDHILVHTYQPPIVTDVSWEPDTNHLEQNSYNMVINASDPKGLSLSYQVTCSDVDVTIVQDTNDPNIFHITYPNYLHNVNVEYTITVINDKNKITTYFITVPVSSYASPVINGITLEEVDQYENETYYMIIDASDPNNFPITYQLECNNLQTIINVDSNSPNKFYVTYPEFSQDTEVIFTATVTNSDGNSSTHPFTILVHNYKPPVINDITWDSTIFYENNSYTLTIDAQDPNNSVIFYSVTSTSNKVNIVQDSNNSNIFHVTYDNFDYSGVSTEPVDLVVTVSNSHELSTTMNLTVDVHIYPPPVINNISWSDSEYFETKSYMMNISASDPNGLPLTYQVSCNDPNVTLSPQNTDGSSVLVTYPIYRNDHPNDTTVTVTYTVIVSNSDGESVTQSFDITVNLYKEPSISSIDWSSSTLFETNTYDMIINATDPNGLPLTYQAVAPDGITEITQDTTNLNKFHITFSDYSYSGLDTIDVTINVTATNEEGLSTVADVIAVVHIYKPPVINSLIWNTTDQYESQNYVLTIYASDPNNLDLTYEVACDNANVVITQDTIESNKFHITYPSIVVDTDITFIITVTNEHSLSETNTDVRTVKAYETPIIDSISWNTGDQWEQNSYDLIINAHDIHGLDLTYDLIADDTNVTITQDTIDLNIFHVTYPNYISNTNVTFTITVTNSDGLHITNTDTRLVKAHLPPSINNITWNTLNHIEQNTYTLTINANDPNGLPLSYQVSCDDPNTTITQDGTFDHIFFVGYPPLSIDTNITFTITVTNTDGLNTVVSDTKQVKAYTAPIIDTVEWNPTGDHIEQNSYDLTITAHDTNSPELPIAYSVACDDTNTNITQDTTNPNVFHVTYPNYTVDTNVTFTITVTNSDSLSDVLIETKLVLAYLPPVINSISWDNKTQIEQHSYVLTIDANDPNGLPLSYQVSCDDPNTTITQDTTDSTMFYITYPSLSIDTNITFTITVTNTDSLSDVTTDVRLVKAYTAPIIDGIEWNDSNQYEQNSYDLTITAHDTNSPPLSISYKVVCDDPNTTIVQDGTDPSIFHVTYPSLSSDITVTFTITVTNSDGIGTDIGDVRLVKAYTAPTINSISWNTTDQYEQNTYDMTVNATDNAGLPLTYQVSCDDTNVTIVQDTTNPNVFHVTYPDYTVDTNVTFTITVTNSDNLSDTSGDIRLAKIYVAPVINSINWDTTDQYEQNTYDMTVNAIDNAGLPLTYQVSCDDTNVTIVQDTTNPNVFHVTYPDYTADTNVTFTITVTNSEGLNTTTTDTRLAKIYTAPTINSISWNTTVQYEQNTYDMTVNAIDNAGLPLTYQVSCDDTNVTIVQDTTDPNIFHVTYPDYTADTNVTFTITVTNSDNLYTTTTDTRLVQAYVAPVINSINWDTSFHVAGNTDTITINAVDPNTPPLPLTYQVTCDDTNTTIVQDTTDPNIFHVTFSTKNADYNVIFTVTVANSSGLDTTTDSVFVYIPVTTEGVFAGGYSGSSSISSIEYIVLGTPGNVTLGSNLTSDKYGSGSTSNGTNDRGVIAGGASDQYPQVSTIEYVTISTHSNSTLFGDLSHQAERLASCSNTTNERGIFAGGSDEISGGSTEFFSTISYITINTTGNASSFGYLLEKTSKSSGFSNGVNDRGVFGGGVNFDINGNQQSINVIQYITISTTVNSLDFGDLSNPRDSMNSASNLTNERGVFAGGVSGSTKISTISYITINTTGNSTFFGNLDSIRSYGTGTSNGTHEKGVFGGGFDSGGVRISTLEQITISVLGNAINFGNTTLEYAKSSLTATSNA